MNVLNLVAMNLSEAQVLLGADNHFLLGVNGTSNVNANKKIEFAKFLLDTCADNLNTDISEEQIKVMIKVFNNINS